MLILILSIYTRLSARDKGQIKRTNTHKHRPGVASISTRDRHFGLDLLRHQRAIAVDNTREGKEAGG